MNKYDRHISVIGANCPIPLIKISRAFNYLHPNQVLSVTGDDPILESSIRDFCEANGIELVEVNPLQGTKVNILIRKCEG